MAALCVVVVGHFFFKLMFFRTLYIFSTLVFCGSSHDPKGGTHCSLWRRNNKDAACDSVISILLHFIMPLSIISTDYMQLDLLYSFFIVCMDRHKKIQVTNTQIYVCVFYTAWRKGQWLALHGYPGWRVRGLGSTVLSKATTQSLSPPLPRVTLFKKQETEQKKNQKDKEVNR